MTSPSRAKPFSTGRQILSSPLGSKLKSASPNLVCDNLQALSVRLHYLDCKNSCGRRDQSTRGDLRTAYRLQAVATPDAPFSPQFMSDIDAETPLEAIAKWARQGALNNKLNPFWVRVVLSECDVLTLQLTTDFVRPHAK